MLVLTRKEGEGIVVGDEVELTVLEIRGSRVKLGFTGPAEIPIHREEVQRDIHPLHDSLRHAECA